jgi:methylthioribose-1-phosphate isomerase
VAQAHGIPFMVAAPVSTIDGAVASGDAMTIAEHPAEEIYRLGDRITSPNGAEFYNPASDVTPARLITAIVTEQGIVAPDQVATLKLGSASP